MTHRMSIVRGLLAGSLVAAACGVFGIETASAAIIYACSNNFTGNLRQVGAPTACRPWETSTFWNQTGIAGPPGPPGPAGGFDVSRIYGKICVVTPPVDPFSVPWECDCDSGDLLITGGGSCPGLTPAMTVSSPVPFCEDETHECGPPVGWVIFCGWTPGAEFPNVPELLQISCYRH